MKTITLYELIGLIKEDKAPKKIRAYENFWVWNKEQEEYIQENKNSKMFGLFCDFLESAILDSLNDKVEILEENKELKKINSLNNVGNSQDLGEFKDKQQLNNHILKNKINEIIDYIKAKENENDK